MTRIEELQDAARDARDWLAEAIDGLRIGRDGAELPAPLMELLELAHARLEGENLGDGDAERRPEALKILSWSCDAPIISGVWSMSLGDDHAQVYVDLNGEGKRATVDGFMSDDEGGCEVVLSYHPRDPATGDRLAEERTALLKVMASEPARFIADSSSGRYAIYLVLCRAAVLGQIGEPVAQRVFTGH